MPEEMYPSEPAEAPAPEETEPKPEATDEEAKEGEDQETVLVAKSALGEGCEVGSTYKMKVVGVYDDEVELAKVKESEGGEDDSEARLESLATEESE